MLWKPHGHNYCNKTCVQNQIHISGPLHSPTEERRNVLKSMKLHCILWGSLESRNYLSHFWEYSNDLKSIAQGMEWAMCETIWLDEGLQPEILCEVPQHFTDPKLVMQSEIDDHEDCHKRVRELPLFLYRTLLHLHSFSCFFFSVETAGECIAQAYMYLERKM